MKYRLQAIIFVFVAFMLGCNEYMIVGVLPDIAHEYHDSLGKLGLLVTVFAWFMLFSLQLLLQWQIGGDDIMFY